ncbi:hypothetical protein FEM03_01155 [Phragmitibacter flavus]|uniref:Uncharacterized protein n=1 Tax=Phragmitibacter flavus TaxID=2576071 RepID=A0A5R8KK66_9BACT|nr:hypothetical protein [Phragmitibacter flavus]TLD72713.1 hypothetical protein FEM03_01155 [Phragmitibacter flavus]
MQALYDWIFHQNADGSGLTLKTAGLILGLALLGKHLWAWLNVDTVSSFLKAFPRSRFWGVALMVVCLAWSMFLALHMDMGEFFTMRRWLLMILPATFILVVMYVPEFLAVRALGTLLLLAASPVLHASFLQPQISRLLLPILAYAWIIGGMFLVGMPYLMRDAVTWLTQSKGRMKAAALAGAAYGALILVFALTSW